MEPAGTEQQRREARRVSELARANQTPYSRAVTRREAGKVIGGTAAALVLPIIGQAKDESSAMVTRTIPSSGEKLPVIGLGTWRAFDVDLNADVRRQLGDVLSIFVKLGGRLIDSSPMYGRAEEVIGDLTSAP